MSTDETATPAGKEKKRRVFMQDAAHGNDVLLRRKRRFELSLRALNKYG
jgi:hypothetical protein